MSQSKFMTHKKEDLPEFDADNRKLTDIESSYELAMARLERKLEF